MEIAIKEFDAVLGEQSNQIDHLRNDVSVTASDLLSINKTGGTITEQGLRTNIEIGLRYIASWMAGTGAVAINNLMEDAATAEISRAQVWQWVKHQAELSDGEVVTAGMVREIIEQELISISEEMGTQNFEKFPFNDAKKIFEEVALGESFADFLTLPAYEIIN